MTGRIFPLRLLRAAGGLRSSRFRVASAAAPFRLHRSDPPSFVLWDASTDGVVGCRFFSSRPTRSKPGVGSRDHRGGGFKSRGAAGQAKSLIDDEAELSDWVSDLKTDSLRLSMTSNDEDTDDDRSRSAKGRGRVGGADRFSSRGGKLDSFTPTRDKQLRHKRGNDFDDFSQASGRGKSPHSRDSLAKRRFGSDLEDDHDDEETGFSSRKGRDFGSGKAMPSTFSRGKSRSPRDSLAKRRFDSDSEDIDEDEDDDEETDFSSRKGRDLRSRKTKSSTNSRGKYQNSRDSIVKRRFDSDLDDEDDDGESGFSSKKGTDRRSHKAMPSSFSRRGNGGRQSVILDTEEKEDEESEDEDALSGFDDGPFGDEDGKEVSVKDLFRSSGSPELDQGDNAQSAQKKSDSGNDSYLSQTRFDECSISSLTLKGVKAAGYERMTLVQEATLPIILKGKDVLAKAKTGTGKTVAFLLPAIELVSKLPPVEHDQRRQPINVLVVCPTRELADQAAVEANNLVKYHPSIGVQVVMGGTRLALEQKRMQTNACQILVATPGRLRDHIENTPGFATRLMGVKVLVLDEADRLLDMGFRKDIEKIVAAVPKQRQTLLFSATVPDEVRQICYIAMKRDLEFINTVEEGSEETNAQVKQMHLIAPLEKQFSILYAILTEHISENVDYKVIVFCTTAMMTRLVAELLSELKLNVREIHSRKPQTYRTRVSKEFKESKGLILVSSDVSARGVDYPNVTFVIQLGVPADREQYIHRLGRTGRKGNEGTGILMLAPWEDFFLSSIKDLPITKAESPTVDLDTRRKVERALAHIEVKNKESAYQAWLGYYNSNKNIGRDKHHLVSLANEFSRCMGLDNPPAVPKLVLRKMGLNNVPGLRAK
ncbi:DEAD-box ATP-dependent RNA helicase 31 [Canna indica]|uniref:ATP-dependent RNA helicase n=1 Tax=Canna indica TaxID=4628 RepID=A0AAQ3KI58_9LILI|nr:DEAD-box ATP-dependent RNA helicase 31 [Canna indica]